MKLESRLEKLEHEFKILKSEIQTTLLEIQEQILIHYYPALRAEEGDPPAHLQEAVDALRVGQQAQMRLKGLQESLSSRRSALNSVPSAFTDVTYEWVDDEEEEEPLSLPSGSAVPPQTREVSLADLRQPRRDAESRTAPPPQTPLVEPTPQTQSFDFAAFAGWVGESIHKVGKARTQKAVETYAAAVSLPAEVKEIFAQLIALSDDPGPIDPSNATGVMEVLVKLDQVWRGGQTARSAWAE